MIHYALRCGSAHAFDGWFASSASFEAQAAAGLLTCPVCADTQVERALMAPRLSSGAREPAPKPETQPPPTPSRAVGALPDQWRAVLATLRAEVERRCDYQGGNFAAEARAIHEGRAPDRPIYGEATDAEVQALAEDGIETARIPWVPRHDG